MQDPNKFVGKYAMAERWVHPWTGIVAQGRDLVYVVGVVDLTISGVSNSNNTVVREWVEVTPILGIGLRGCIAPIAKISPLTKEELKENALRTWGINGAPMGKMPGPEAFWSEENS